MSYTVDLGDHAVVWSERKVKSYYKRKINHTEYPTFEDWMWDMSKMGLVIEKYK